ncbi:MAG TPA: DUF4236 domain-containing protein, partial [Anaerolineales bacterium]|nr:DUF4236 domain-containing protein [Anaerolineales bacterium]
PIRFRRVFDIFPGVRLNLSRHGISTSIGPRGAHLTFDRFGVRQSVGLPGSGLSETSYLVGGHKSAEEHHSIHQGEGSGCHLSGCGCFLVFLLIVGVIAYLGASSLHMIPANYALSHLLEALTQWIHKSGF